MSLLPIMFREMIRPMRMVEQHMRLMQEEMMNPRYFPSIFNSPVFQRQWKLEYPESEDSKISTDKDKFQVKMDVQHFQPNEISVKMTDNSVIVEAKHEDKPDDKGFISRQLVRRFLIPEGHDLKQIVSSLSSDGVLTITAPKSPEAMEREIPITHTGPERIEKKKIETENETEVK